MDRVTFGLVGTGGIAQSQHLPNMLRTPHVRLKTICDRRQDVLAAMQVKYAVPNAVTEVDDLLGDDEIAAVIVATREDAQAPLTIRALEAGKHVYVEKPLAETPEACRAVVEAAERSGRHVAVGFNRRFAPAYRKAKEIADADGGPKNVYYRISDDYSRGWGKGYPPGVRVVHEVCHVFDILRWFTGSEVATLYCVNSRADDELIVMRYGSGCVAVIMDSGYGTPDLPKERLEMVTDHGAVTCQEYVELRTFGQAGYDPVYRFAGHTHPDREYTHRGLFEKLGEDALLAVRREYMEKTAPPAPGGLPAAERAYYEKHHAAHVPMINYSVDKGWIASLDGFAASIALGETPENAAPEDALKASLLAQATVRSRASGEVVAL